MEAEWGSGGESRTSGSSFLKRGVMLGSVLFLESCCVIRTYVSPLSLSAVSSHDVVQLLIPRTPVVGFLGSA